MLATEASRNVTPELWSPERLTLLTQPKYPDLSRCYNVTQSEQVDLKFILSQAALAASLDV